MVRPGVDVKSLMQYARWLGPGTGCMADLPAAVRALAGEEETTPARGEVVLSCPRAGHLGPGGRGRPGAATPSATSAPASERGLALVQARSESGAGSQAFGVARFLAAQHARAPGTVRTGRLGGRDCGCCCLRRRPRAHARRAVANGLEAAVERAA